MKNGLDEQYIDLLKDILENGVEKNTRNGKVLSVFGRTIKFNFKDGKFPAVTTKKLHFKGVVSELLWFLNGRTDLRYLLEHNNFIWVGDAYKKYMKTINEIIEGYKSGDMLGSQPHIENMFSDADNLIPLTKEEFINKIKTDDEFAKKWGELGPIYGRQWRSWKGSNGMIGEEDEDGIKMINWNKIDQIQNLINDLKTNPDSRRLMVNAWAVHDLPNMVLPPCHYGFQVYTRELSHKERFTIHSNNPIAIQSALDNKPLTMEETNTPTRAISLMFNMRSTDVGLGLSFNVASYSLLLMMIAKQVNMVPYELIYNGGDVHLYLNHIEPIKEQLTREPYPLPTVKISDRVVSDISEYTLDDIILENYQSHPSIKMPVSN